jgi:predicted nucleic acid-binding protein
MMVLVDTPIWSFAYRRNKPSTRERELVAQLVTLIQKEVAVLTGAIRQEVLSGITDTKHFEDVRATLRGFVEFPPTTADYELAATFCNQCRRKGVQGSPTDFLICAIAASHNAEIYTADHDFTNYAKYLGIRLHRPARR